MLYPNSLPTRVELQMNVVGGGLTIQMQMEDKVFLFCHFLKKKKPYALSYILPLYYLNLFHTVQCISSIMSNVLVICIFRLYVVESYQEKMHGFLARKVFACVRMVSSFSLSSDFIFCFHLAPPMSSTMSVMKLSLYFPSSFFYVVSFCLVRLIAPLKPNK